MEELKYSDELQHYGVVGMKWGVRRGNASKAFAKSSTKAKKMHTQAVNKNLKSAKLQKKALKKETNATSEKQYRKARKMQFKANKLTLKSAKLQKKAMKWEKRMSKEFSNVKISDVSPEHLEIGKQYVYMLMRD